MKKKEYQDFKIKTLKDLNKPLEDKRLELAKTKADLKVSREKNLKKAKNLRRDIAQILTIIREKEIMEESLQSQRIQKGESQKAQKGKESAEKSVPSA